MTHLRNGPIRSSFNDHTHVSVVLTPRRPWWVARAIRLGSRRAMAWARSLNWGKPRRVSKVEVRPDGSMRFEGIDELNLGPVEIQGKFAQAGGSPLDEVDAGGYPKRGGGKFKPVHFKDANPLTGEPGTVLTADWLNGIQDEIARWGLNPRCADLKDYAPSEPPQELKLEDYGARIAIDRNSMLASPLKAIHRGHFTVLIGPAVIKATVIEAEREAFGLRTWGIRGRISGSDWAQLDVGNPTAKWKLRLPARMDPADCLVNLEPGVGAVSDGLDFVHFSMICREVRGVQFEPIDALENQVFGQRCPSWADGWTRIAAVDAEHALLVLEGKLGRKPSRIEVDPVDPNVWHWRL